MRFSHLFGKTLRQAPAEAETPNHQLLLRARLVTQLTAGVYSYLPLGWRALLKLRQIIREEMDAAGGQEVWLPALQPVEMWEASGRRKAFGETLFVLKDRRDRELALGPTHEEVIVDLFKRLVQSYRELPVLVYQMQTKFRDEPRPRGGLMRTREFTMMDLYSFDADDASLDVSYGKMLVAYKNSFDRCGVPSIAVLADSGPIGGRDSQEFMHLTDVGEDQVLICPNGDYAANTEKAAFRKERKDKGEEPLPVEEVATPGQKTIDDLVAFLGVPPWKTLKAVFYASDGAPVFVAMRGDLEVNEIKLRNALGGGELRLMDDREVEAAGLVAGAASPSGLKGIRVVADDSVVDAPNLVGGGNSPDVHVRNLNYGRDWQAEIVADIALAREGDACPECGTPLQMRRAIELGHVFKLGTIYSDKLGATYLDAEGKARPVIMGCYGIGVERLLATVIEANHDEKGIIWPASVAPYQVHLVALNVDNASVRETAEKLYADLQAAGVEVFYDDREESPGVKFNDADLLGMPLRVTVSQRTLEKQSVELKRRREKESTLAPLAEAVALIAIKAKS
ncbi:MAG: proline--tRNA ligase [Dehalococcoidia bacterium]|jgi:prolyl-tRNA synthetase